MAGLNRLISEQLDAGDNSLDYTTTFGFDLASNRMEERKDDGSDGATTPDEVTTYEYDANDRLLTERADTNDYGTTDQTLAYAYGANVDLRSGYGGDGTSQTEKTVCDGDAVADTFTSRMTLEYYNALGQFLVPVGGVLSALATHICTPRSNLRILVVLLGFG